MAATVTFVYMGPPEQKHAAKVGPMATLRSVLTEAAAKWRPPVDPATATVLHAKKPVDLDTPFRLLNIPAGSRLDVHHGTPAAAAAPAVTAPAAAQRASEARLQQTQDPSQQQQHQQQQQAQPQQQPPPQQQQQQQQQQPQAQAQALPATCPHSPATDPSTSGASAPAAGLGAARPVDPALAMLGIRVPAIAVFNQRAVEAAAVARGPPPPAAAGPPDDFFELTPEDLADAARAAQRRAAADGQLLTRAAREQAARARAEALGPVLVRLHFPDGSIVQAEFSAVQPASDVAALARAVASPALAAGLYLFTAPPKAVLRDKELAASLYELRLVPAAHVHVGGAGAGAEHGAQWLRPEIASLMSDAVPDLPASRAAAARGGGRAEAVEALVARERERAVAEARRQANSAAAGSGAEGGTKVPKWLKR